MTLRTELLSSPHLRLIFSGCGEVKDQLQVSAFHWESCLYWEL